jgi:hypothetical protein
MRDLMNQIHPVRALSPVASAADNTPLVSQIIDRLTSVGFESLTFLIATGAIPDVDATFTVLLEHGDIADGSDMAAVPDEQLIGLEADGVNGAGFKFDDDNKVYKLGYVGEKQYTRLTITPVANASATLLAVIALLGHPHATPTANPPESA